MTRTASRRSPSTPARSPEPRTGSVVPPIYQTSTYAQDAVGAPREGYEYSRSGNPTRDALQECLRGAGGRPARAGLRQRSGGRGHPAPHGLPAGRPRGDPGRRVRRHVPALRQGGRALGPGLDRRPRSPTSTRSAPRSGRASTKMIWVETPTNPLLGIADIAATAALAHDNGALLVVDNTFASPYLQQPHRPRRRRRGALDDQVHRRALRRGRRRAGRRRRRAGRASSRFHQNAMGAVNGPFDAWLTLRGIKTLGVRMDRHCDNAERIAEYLRHHRAVAKVLYPGLPDHPGHETAAKQMRRFGGMISFRAAGGEAARGRHLQPGQAVRAGRVARRGRVVDRAPGPDDPRERRRLAA